jgi:hypothetical protein
MRDSFRHSLPPGSPIWGFTAHVGGRTPSRVHMWGLPFFSFFGCIAALCLHVSQSGVLFCIVLSSQLSSLRVCVY